MGQSVFDERDMMFNVMECPGSTKVLEMEKYENFGVDDLEMIFEQAKQFADEFLVPSNSDFDREGTNLIDGHVISPGKMKELWENYKELGITGVSCNPEYGGAGMPHLFGTPLSELECGGNLSFSMLPLLTKESANLIDSFGSKSLKERYLEKMYTGEWAGTMCLTEPQAGSDVGAAATKAVPDGEKYKITGTKSFISWGDHDLCENIIHLVLARVSGAPRGSRGLSLFVVPKFKITSDDDIGTKNDVICSSVEHKMGIKASPTCVLNFGEEGHCEGFIVGKENDGLKYMFQMMNAARNGVGMQGLAIASVAYMHAMYYAAERKQGSLPGKEGSTEIVNHPDVRFMLMKMRALVQASRSMIYHGAYYEDLATHSTEGEKAHALFELLTPINKSYGSDQGFRITELAMQVYGGYGYCIDYPIEQLMRDIKITSIYEGTNGIQAMDLLFRKILGTKGTTAKLLIQEIMQVIEESKKTELSDLGTTLEKTTGVFSSLLATLGNMAKEKNYAGLQFHATQFLNAMGHFTGGYFLLKSALIALPKKDDSDPFYAQKIQTTRFFFSYIFPEAESIFKMLQKEDGSLVSSQVSLTV